MWYIDMGCGIYMAEILGKGHDDTEVYIKVHGWLGRTFNCKKCSLMTREEAVIEPGIVHVVYDTDGTCYVRYYVSEGVKIYE